MDTRFPTDNEPTIREAREEEFAEANLVLEAAYAPLRRIYRPKPTAYQSKRERERTSRRLVAVVGRRVVGGVRVTAEGDRYGLFALGVYPDWQRRGIGRRLVEAVERIAQDEGGAEVSLYTIEQTGNVPFFQALGYEVVSREPDRLFESLVPGPLMEVHLRKVLSRSD